MAFGINYNRTFTCENNRIFIHWQQRSKTIQRVGNTFGQQQLYQTKLSHTKAAFGCINSKNL